MSTSSSSLRQSNSSSSTSSSGREVCKYFRDGLCRFGDNCYFSHATTQPPYQSNNNRTRSSNNTSTNPPIESSSSSSTSGAGSTNICKYYLQGRCLFGANCFNRHVRPSNQNQGATSTSSNSSRGISNSRTVNQAFFDEEEPDDDDEMSYETARTTIGTTTGGNYNSSSSTSSASSSSSTSPHSSNSRATVEATTSSNSDNSQLVRRTIGANKPKLRLATKATPLENTNLSVLAKPFEPRNKPASRPGEETGGGATTPASYFEALTGKALVYADLDLDSSELNIFEPAYAEYLRKKKLASDAAAASSHIPLCPYSEMQLECPFGESCDFGHALLCDQCQQMVLDPNDEEQQRTHRVECARAIEADMEEAFATAASRERVCGICMEVVWEKDPVSERRFGILESCNHVYCLSCIRKWRASKAYENKVVKACPECRVKSDYVTPSRFWFDNEEAKKKIIDDYKNKLRKTDCKYFKKGDGTCPFGNKCFYLHQYKDGRLATNLPEPTRRRRLNRFGRLESFQSLVQIEFNFSDDEDNDDDDDDDDDFYAGDSDDEFDLFELFRRSFFDRYNSDIFELSADEFLF